MRSQTDELVAAIADRTNRWLHSPAMALSKVVLPAPLAPRIATTSPVRTRIDTSHKARWRPYACARLSISSILVTQIGANDLGVAQDLLGRPSAILPPASMTITRW